MGPGGRDVLAQGIQPGVPALVGGPAGRQAQGIGLGVAGGGQLAAEGPAQVGIGDEDVGDLQTGEVEGLRRRGAGDRVGGGRLAQGGEGRRRETRQGQVRVNLIGHDDDAMVGRDLLQRGELLAAPDPAHRVVRVAQEQQARTGRLDGLLQGGQVAAVDAVGVTHEGDGGHGALVDLDDVAEGVVDGLLDEDRLTRCGQGPYRQGQGRHDARGHSVPLGLHLPAVAAGEPAGQGCPIGLVGLGVAEDAVAGAPQQGTGDCRSGGVVHVRHPQGQDVLGAAALDGGVPLEAGRAAAVGDRVEDGRVDGGGGEEGGRGGGGGRCVGGCEVGAGRTGGVGGVGGAGDGGEAGVHGKWSSRVPWRR